MSVTVQLIYRSCGLGVSSLEMNKHKASPAGKSVRTYVNKLYVNSTSHCVLLVLGLCFTDIKHEG